MGEPTYLQLLRMVTPFIAKQVKKPGYNASRKVNDYDTWLQAGHWKI